MWLAKSSCTYPLHLPSLTFTPQRQIEGSICQMPGRAKVRLAGCSWRQPHAMPRWKVFHSQGSQLHPCFPPSPQSCHFPPCILSHTHRAKEGSKPGVLIEHCSSAEKGSAQALRKGVLEPSRLPPAATARAPLCAHCRADSIVRDAEVVRQALVPQDNCMGKWSTLGQSFGGFCSLTYLSIAPEGG